MKIITFLLLIIAVNCKGQIVDTTKPMGNYVPVKKLPVMSDLNSGYIIQNDKYNGPEFKKIVIQQPDKTYCIITTLNDKIGNIYYSDTLPHFDSIWIFYGNTPLKGGQKTWIGCWVNWR